MRMVSLPVGVLTTAASYEWCSTSLVAHILRLNLQSIVFSRYMFCPNHLHAYSLKKIGRYLKITRYRGLILNTNNNIFNIDSYPDADFSGMYRHDKPDDTSFVKSRTIYIIKILDFPVLCQSKLQTETSLSTIKSEIVDLAQNCR